jgi:rubrerythrin
MRNHSRGRRSMRPNEKLLKAIDTAIQLEREGLKFYTEAAEQISDSKAKSMFQALARDEAAHLKLFEDAREALLNGDVWPSAEETLTTGRPQPNVPPIFSAYDTAEEKGTPQSPLATLERGIRAEEDSIAFYIDQLDKTDDPDGEAMYNFLIEQEECHRAMLQEEYDFRLYHLQTDNFRHTSAATHADPARP